MKKLRLACALLACVLLCACAEKAPENTAPRSPDPAPVTEPAPAPEPEPEIEPEPEPDPGPQPDRSAEPIYLAHPELTPVDYDSPALLPLTGDMGQAYLDSLTFLCDSPTYWMWPFGMLAGGSDSTQLWTGPEKTLTLAYLRGYTILDPYDYQLRTIPEAAALHRPEIMVIALGLNGIAFMDEDYFKEEYLHLIGEIREASPDTELILQSMYPISPTFVYWGSITNESISRGNRWILEIAEEADCRYLDTFSALLGEDGHIRPELSMDDGFHPNREGLQLILDYIRTHGLPDRMPEQALEAAEG